MGRDEQELLSSLFYNMYLNHILVTGTSNVPKLDLCDTGHFVRGGIDMIIKTVEKICESLRGRGRDYYKTYKKMESNGELTREKSPEVKDAFNKLHEWTNIISYLNFKCGNKEFANVYQASFYYLIKINGLNAEIKLLNEYVEGGVEEDTLEFTALDPRGSNEFWIGVADELLRAASDGEFRDEVGFHKKEWERFEDYEWR